MKATTIRKYIGYAGQVGIVLVSLYLLYTVAMGFYLYDIEFSGGSDDARWTIPNRHWDSEDTVSLIFWGLYLLVTGTHMFLYFSRLSSMKEFNMWALPSCNIGDMKILSAILSLILILFVIFFDTNMPEVFTSSVTRAEYSEMPYYDGIDSFWAVWVSGKWMIFTFLTSLHLYLYIVIKHTRQLYHI